MDCEDMKTPEDGTEDDNNPVKSLEDSTQKEGPESPDVEAGDSKITENPGQEEDNSTEEANKRKLEVEEEQNSQSPPKKRAKSKDVTVENTSEEMKENESVKQNVEGDEKMDDSKIIQDKENARKSEKLVENDSLKSEESPSLKLDSHKSQESPSLKSEDSTDSIKVETGKSMENDSVHSEDSLCVKSLKGSENDKGGKNQQEDVSSVKSEDSEKENRRTEVDTPIDLTTKTGLVNGGSDIIMLSDSEEELMNGDINGDMNDLQDIEVLKRKKYIKRLQAELRNEEAKLILLRKMRQSQISSHSVPDTNKPKQHTQPPPLVRPGHQPNQARPAHSQPPQLMRNNQVTSNRNHQQGPPPLVNMRGQNVPNGNNIPQQMRYQGMQGQPNARGMYGQNMGSNSQNQNSNAQVDTQTPAQRQAAAKMALRKQLEKTLLQIPPPKPPPPEMNFVPNLTNTDFIYLLGLEEAVNYIIDANLISKGQKNPDEKMVCNPFTCVQCGTDFTPVWKREKAGSKNVICEHCVTTNQKKALKQEHTNRLKSAFVKALQQEQEIERMQAQEKNQSSSLSAASPVSSSSSVSNTLPTNSASYSKEALRQHQNFLQAHQAVTAHHTALRMGQPLGLTPFGTPGPFSYQIPFGGGKQDLNQLQRKYLLDMIPPRGWKQ